MAYFLFLRSLVLQWGQWPRLREDSLPTEAIWIYRVFQGKIRGPITGYVCIHVHAFFSTHSTANQNFLKAFIVAFAWDRVVWCWIILAGRSDWVIPTLLSVMRKASIYFFTSFSNFQCFLSRFWSNLFQSLHLHSILFVAVIKITVDAVGRSNTSAPYLWWRHRCSDFSARWALSFVTGKKNRPSQINWRRLGKMSVWLIGPNVICSREQ